MQLPADRRAYTAARAKTDPAERLAAMRQFVTDFPKSDRVSRTQTAILDLLIAYFPTRVSEIDAQAKHLVMDSPEGSSRRNQAQIVASKLATANIDLPLAEHFAAIGINHTPQAVDAKERIDMYTKAKYPPPAAKELLASYNQDKSEAFSIQALVFLHEGKLDEARKSADEALALDPTVDDTNSVRAEIAVKDHDNAKALDFFERAQIYGALNSADSAQMHALYRELHNGSDAGLITDQDARYEKLFPAPFTPAAHPAASASHTVLLELFTGSGCMPCVGGDLAMEGVLSAYPRSEVIALAFDQHIPLPDPLTNADSVAHGKEYDIAHTPTFSIDGQLLTPGGGDRTDAEHIYQGVTKALDYALALPAAAQIQLTADLNSGIVEAHAHLTLPTDDALQKELAVPPVAPEKPEADAASKPAPATTPATPAATPAAITPALNLNFALVEDEVRYSGENGIRFHRMVVRALAKPSGEGFPLTPASTASLDASFDLAAITKTNADYLAAFARHNERFENVQFLSTDTSINPAKLKVVAWIENTTDHRVLQAAFVSLNSTTMKEGQ